MKNLILSLVAALIIGNAVMFYANYKEEITIRNLVDRLSEAFYIGYDEGRKDAYGRVVYERA